MVPLGSLVHATPGPAHASGLSGSNVGTACQRRPSSECHHRTPPGALQLLPTAMNSGPHDRRSGTRPRHRSIRQAARTRAAGMPRRGARGDRWRPCAPPPRRRAGRPADWAGGRRRRPAATVRLVEAHDLAEAAERTGVDGAVLSRLQLGIVGHAASGTFTPGDLRHLARARPADGLGSRSRALGRRCGAPGCSTSSTLRHSSGSTLSGEFFAQVAQRFEIPVHLSCTSVRPPVR